MPISVAPPSLRALAVGWLARREHSERELQRKLLRRLRQTGADGRPPDPAADATPQEQVAAVIDWLRQHGLLDERRFVASRIDATAGRFGVQRIAYELAQHGLELDAAAAQSLRASEFDRAIALWRRRYGGAAADPGMTARQARFLAGRGFSNEVIRQVLRVAQHSGEPDG